MHEEMEKVELCLNNLTVAVNFVQNMGCMVDVLHDMLHYDAGVYPKI